MRKMKRILTHTCAAIMILTLCAMNGFVVLADLYTFSGSGTLNDPYKISTAEDLQGFSANVLAGTSYSGQYLALTDNINMTNVAFTQIGSTSKVFSGTLLGSGFTISNYTGTAGLFNTLSGASIRNLILENVKISASASYTGGIADYGSNSAAVSDCVVSGAIVNSYSNATRVGGIIGYMQSGAVISGCVSAASVTAVSTGSTAHAGGLTAATNGTKYSNGTTLTPTIRDSYSTGVITATGAAAKATYAAAGVVASLGQVSAVIGCYSTSEIRANALTTGTAYAGGIAGMDYTGSEITSCYALNTSVFAQTEGAAYVGSIAGKNTSTYSGCYGAVPAEYASSATSVTQGAQGGYIQWQDIAAGTAFPAWNTDIWDITAGKLPAIRSVPASLQVSPNKVFASKTNWLYESAFSLPDKVYAIKNGLLETIGGVTWKDATGSAVTAEDIRTSVASYLLTPVLPESETTEFVGKGKMLTTVAKLKIPAITVYLTQNATAQELESSIPNFVTATLNGQSIALDNIVWETQDTVDTSLIGSVYTYTMQMPQGYTEDQLDVASYALLTVVVNPVGSGTQEDPFHIGSVSALRWLQANAAANNNWSGKYFMQTTNIDMTGAAWTAAIPFAGVYQGGGYEITNLTAGNGIFSTISGRVSDLGITNASISAVSTGTVSAGVLAVTIAGTVTGCYATGSITAAPSEGATAAVKANIGGLAASLTGTVTNCYAKVDITSYCTGGTTVGVGGLLGSAATTNKITSCFADSNIFIQDSTSGGTILAGGIVGYAGMVENCYSKGSIDVTASAVYCGGISGGYYGGGVINRCYSAVGIKTEEIKGTVSGIYGYVTGSSYTVTNCVAVNPYIVTRGTQSDRVAHYVNAMGATGYSGNYAIDQMSLVRNGKLYTVLDSQKSTTQSYGSNLTTANLNQVAFAGYSSDVWTLEDGRLPVLKGIASTSQSGDIPDYTVYDTTIVPQSGMNEAYTVSAPGTVAVDIASLTQSYNNTELVNIYRNNHRLQSVIVAEGKIIFDAPEAGEYIIERTKYKMSDFFTASFAAQYTPAIYSGTSSFDSPGLSIGNGVIVNSDVNQSNGLGGSWKGYGVAFDKKAVWKYETRDSTTGKLIGYVVFDGENMKDVAPIGPVDAYIEINSTTERLAQLLSWHSLYAENTERTVAAMDLFAAVQKDPYSMLIDQPFMRQFKYDIMTYGFDAATLSGGKFKPGDKLKLKYLLGSYNLNNYHSSVPTTEYALAHEMDFSTDDTTLTVDKDGMVEFTIHTGGFFSLTKDTTPEISNASVVKGDGGVMVTFDCRSGIDKDQEIQLAAVAKSGTKLNRMAIQTVTIPVESTHKEIWIPMEDSETIEIYFWEDIYNIRPVAPKLTMHTPI